MFGVAMSGTLFRTSYRSLLVYVIVCSKISFGNPASEIVEDQLEASLFDECMLKEDIVFCFENTMLDTVELLANTTSIRLLDGIYLVKSRTPTYNTDVSTSRGRNSIHKAIWRRLYDLFTTRSIHIDLPTREVGRVKKKNLYEYGLVALLVGAFLIPLKIQGLAVVAGMALVISKIALALITSAGLKQLASQNQKQEQPWIATSSSHRRAQIVDPHLIVYKAVEPAR